MTIRTTDRVRYIRFAYLVLAVIACRPAEAPEAADSARMGPYLYVFAGDADHTASESDFLAVIDADSLSPTYAQVLATTPIGAGGTMPHHTELSMPAGGRPLFANSFMTGRTYLFDFANPLSPRIAGTLDSVPGFRMPHSFARLADGSVLATMQFGDGKAKGDPGGLALFTSEGRLIRAVSSADSAFSGAGIRTYSLDVNPASDRVITTSSPMDTSSTTADVVQLWRLSDLTLLRTISLPRTSPDSTSRYPFEVRFFPDGRSAFLNTYNCGFYLLSGLNGDAPTLEPVLALEQPRNVGCGVPLLIGRWWLMPISNAHEFVVYDVSDPRKPRRASALATDSAFFPHWMSPEAGSNRIVLSAEGKQPSVRIVRFDSTTGTLSWDERFREKPDGPLGVRFDRAEWPHGKTGSAQPHGTVFSRPQAAVP
jgi:hypothetical protein